MNDDNTNPSRRDFLRIGAAAGLGAAVAGLGFDACSPGVPGEGRTEFRAPALSSVKVGFVGVGGMGSAHVRNLLNIDGVELRAVCDIVPAKVERAQKWVVEAGQPEPKGFTNGPRDFERMCETEDLDLVFTATPWEWHVPVCLAAMKNGKHAATEVPAAMSLDDCWALVETAEKTGKHCLMMENCCYDRIEMHDPEPGPQGRARRGPPRRGRLPARPPRRQVLEGRARGCGGGRGPRSSTATSTRPTAWARSPSA